MAVSRSRKARAAVRRKRRLERMVHDLADEQWFALRAVGCAYCGVIDEALQRDCVLPISRGGRYTLDNVVPACRSCNTSKCNDEVTSWLRRKRLDERAFLLRQLEIRAALWQSASLDPGEKVRAPAARERESLGYVSALLMDRNLAREGSSCEVSIPAS